MPNYNQGTSPRGKNGGRRQIQRNRKRVGGRGRNGGGHFHGFQGQQQHLQQYGNTSNQVQVTAPRKYKHVHSGLGGAPNVHSHNFSSPVVQHWTGRPGVGPQGGYSVQQSPIPEQSPIHGYRHIHPGTIGGIGGGRSRRRGSSSRSRRY